MNDTDLARELYNSQFFLQCAIKAVIFDCDGTLVDSEHAHYLGWQYALQQQGADLAVEDYYVYVGNSVENNAKLMAEKIGKPSCAAKIVEDKRAYYRKLHKEGLPPFDTTVNLVHQFSQEEGIKLAVASAAKKEEIIGNLHHLQIDHHFDIVLSGQSDLDEYHDPEGTNKPKPYIYLQAAKMLGVLPSECLVIEDSSAGVAAGCDAGCFVIAIPNAFTKQQDLSRAHMYLESFEGILPRDLLTLIERRLAH